MIKKLLIFGMIISNSIQAVEVTKDSVCFSREEELQARQLVLDGQYYETKTIKLEQLYVSQDSTIKLQEELLKTKEQQISTLIKKDSSNKFMNVLYFVGGVVATGAAVYLSSKIGR